MTQPPRPPDGVSDRSSEEPYRQPRTVEEQRARLRRLLRTSPADPRIQQAMQATLTVPHIRNASARGAFICYHRADELSALELATDLRAADINVWMDMIDVPEGSDWRREVELALQRCGVLLLLLSPASLMDNETRSEVRLFLGQGKIVVPVLLQHCDYEHLALQVPPIDCRHDYQAGLYQLTQLLGAATSSRN